MSYKELAIQLINNMPDYKLGYAIAYLQGLVADESADDLYCAGLLDEYKNDTEKDDVVSFEEAAKMWSPGESPFPIREDSLIK